MMFDLKPGDVWAHSAPVAGLKTALALHIAYTEAAYRNRSVVLVSTDEGSAAMSDRLVRMGCRDDRIWFASQDALRGDLPGADLLIVDSVTSFDSEAHLLRPRPHLAILNLFQQLRNAGSNPSLPNWVPAPTYFTHGRFERDESYLRVTSGDGTEWTFRFDPTTFWLSRPSTITYWEHLEG